MTAYTGRLVLMSPEKLRGHVLVVRPDRAIVGRGEKSDLLIDDARTSTAHAVLVHSDDKVTVEDLASKNGTMVNGQIITGPQPLRHGDIVQFGSAQARYEESAAPSETMMAPAVSVPARAPAHITPTPVRFDVQQQRAGQLNNVGGNQYVQHVRQVRQSFLRDIAAARTRARRLIMAGFVVMVAGIAVYLGVWLRVARETQIIIDNSSSAMQNGQIPATPSAPEIFGPMVGGIPVGALGLVATTIGFIILIVGIVLHIVAASRRRRVEEQIVRPWSPAEQW